MSLRDRSVVAIAYDRLSIFELGMAAEVFGRRRRELGVSWYDFRICALEGPPLRADGGLEVTAAGGLKELEGASTIVVPGWRDIREPPPERLLEALRRAHGRGGRLLSVCSGVFILAATGLLDGKRATTHWRYCEALAERFPRVRVDPGVLYVDEGSILTSAGSAAGLDLFLHVVRKDYGAHIANLVARRLVVQPHREGGQAQFIPSPLEQREPGSLAELLAWSLEHLHRSLPVSDLARRAGMSPRTFARHFRAATGTTPLRWLNRQRIVRAQEMLEASDAGIDEIADECGFGSAQLFRLHFRRQLGTTPSRYRKGFRGV